MEQDTSTTEAGLDAALSPFITSLSDYIPLPFRVLALVSLGILCWALNLHVLHILGIDTSFLLDIRSPSDSSEYLHPSRLYRPVYQLAAVSIAWTTFAWLVGFRLVAASDASSDLARAVAAVTWVVPLAVLLMPVDKLKRAERFMYLRALRRTATDSIFRPVPFCDVILADMLTSFAKVLGDLWVCVCMILNLDDVENAGYKQIGVPLLIALPYLFRFRQCVSEYFNTPSDTPSNGGHIQLSPASSAANVNTHSSLNHLHHSHRPSIFLAPTSASSSPASPKKRSLCNALKYASALPVIVFSALQGGISDPHDHAGIKTSAASASSGSVLGSNLLFRVWILSVLLNSMYSFWWDVTNDWGLHMLLPSRRAAPIGSGESFGLRRTMLLPDVVIYYLVVALDFILRFTWSLKLSSHLHTVHEMEAGIFLLEALEVIRRWMWVYVRLEWEAVRKGGDALEERLARSSSGISLLPMESAGSANGLSLDRKVSANHRKAPTRDSGMDSDTSLGPGRPGIQ